jgi:Flp pilus assembly protein TadG
MAILLAIMEFGYAFFIQASVASAARVGARYYAIAYNSPDAATATHAAATAIAMAKSAVPDSTNVVDSATDFTTTCTAGAQTTFVVTYRYRSMTGLLDSLVGTNLTVTGKGSMECGG